MGKTEEQKMNWQERKKTIKHKWQTPFIYVEWRCERLSYRLGRWAFLDILGHLGRLAILVAVISYFMGAKQRRMQAENQRKAKHYQAWQVINVAKGSRSSGGRIDALQDLNKDGVSLKGVDVSKAYLSGIDLKDADLIGANFSGADLSYAKFSIDYFDNTDLSGANFSGADLYWADIKWADLSDANFSGANLNYAKLRGANLSGADLTRANLSGADLTMANLSGADLHYANLSGADLSDANLSGADLSDTNLSGADLSDTNLSGADLDYANLSGADLDYAELLRIHSLKDIESIEYANIYKVKNPPDGFIEWATAPEQGAVEIADNDEWEALLEEERGKKKN